MSRKTGSLRQPRSVDELQRVAIAGTMAHGLPVAADRGNGARSDPGTGEQPAHGAGIEVGQLVREDRGAVQLVVTALLQGKQARTQPRRIRKMDASQKLEALAACSGKHCVNAVVAGAGHQPDIELGHRKQVNGER